MTVTPNNPQKSSDRYTLPELHQEIARDEEWRERFRYLPKAANPGLKFYLIARKEPYIVQNMKLLIGTHKANGQHRVHAQVDCSQSGAFNLVSICLHDGTVASLHQQQIEKKAGLLHGVNYIEPFERLEKVGSGNWRKSLRFLVLYYYLEKGLIDKIVFTMDGLEAFKKACTSIARQPIRTQKKPTRPPLIIPRIPSSVLKPQAQSSNEGNGEVEEKLSIMREHSPVMPVKAPENDSTRAVSTMIQQDDKIAARLLPKTVISHQGYEQKYEPAPAVLLPAYETKRKRSASDDTMKQEEEDPQVVFNRFKRLVRLKIESLEREETAVHDTLSAQTIALEESKKSMLSVEKAFLAAKVRLEAAKAAKAATELKLEEVRSEVAKNKTFEKDFDAFQA